jgi:hypothetical protein
MNQPLTTIPMPGMPMAPAQIRPAAWTPAPYRPGPSPFMAQPRRRMGQIFGSKSLFDHPGIALAVDAGAISISIYGIKNFKSKTWRTVAWATLIATGVKAVNDLVRLFTSPGPAPSVQPPPQGTTTAPMQPTQQQVAP